MTLPRSIELSNQFARAGLNGQKWSADQEVFLDSLAVGLRKDGHRSDLKAPRQPFKHEGRHYVDVEFNGYLGHPPYDHLERFLANRLPACEIRRDDIDLKATGLLRVGIQVREDRITLTSSTPPPAFYSIGSALFMKHGDDHSIWALEQDEDGKYALVRRESETSAPVFGELPRQADELQPGDRVRTPEGIGHFLSADRHGNATVDLDGSRYIFREGQVIRDMPSTVPGLPPDHREGDGKFNRSKEQSYEADYYAKVFGDKDFADQLVNSEFAKPSPSRG